jgi:NTP pyrophosphatase (non-canonical NTP hydrolase)/predicted kinase
LDKLTLVLVGPPAAGKTTVAHFVAQAMRFESEGDGPRVVIDAVESVDALEACAEASERRCHVLGIEAPAEVRRRRWVARAESQGVDAATAVESFEQAERAWDKRLLDHAEAIIRTGEHHLLTAQVVSVVQTWLDVKPRALFAEMFEAVAEFHRKNDFPVGDGDRDTLYRHQALLTEELGEIASAITKGSGEVIEEHADVLVLVLGSAVAMGWDIEEAFWRKMDKIMAREGRIVEGELRVSAWGAKEAGTLRQLMRLRSLRRILHPESPEQLELGDEGEGQTELNLGV